MCNCNKACNCPTPVAVDWTKPVKVTSKSGFGTNDEMVTTLLGSTNHAYGSRYSLSTKFPDGSGNIVIADKDGMVIYPLQSWEFKVVNIPKPKRKVKTYLFVLANDLVGKPASKVIGPMSETDAEKGGYLNHPSYRILKTEEFEYEE